MLYLFNVALFAAACVTVPWRDAGKDFKVANNILWSICAFMLCLNLIGGLTNG